MTPGWDPSTDPRKNVGITLERYRRLSETAPPRSADYVDSSWLRWPVIFRKHAFSGQSVQDSAEPRS